jgi:hypothetical protein
MRVVEAPFVSREAVLSVLRPGEVTSERPFRTLRERHAASEGLAIPIRTPGGQVLGRVQLYSSLNTDAARAYRLRQVETARELAARAVEIERSSPAQRIRDAVASMVNSLPIDPLAAEAPLALQRYLKLRARSTWRGADRPGLVREWLSSADAWLSADSEDRDALIEATVEIDRSACQAREDILPGGASSATTFYGVVRRMDATAAELEGASAQMLLVPREDLERQGLAILGQPVALLRETLPGGGSYNLPLPAVALDRAERSDAPSPWDPDFVTVDDGSLVEITKVSDRDMDWLERELAREPTALLAAPLPVA